MLNTISIHINRYEAAENVESTPSEAGRMLSAKKIFKLFQRTS